MRVTGHVVEYDKNDLVEEVCAQIEDPAHQTIDQEITNESCYHVLNDVESDASNYLFVCLYGHTSDDCEIIDNFSFSKFIELISVLLTEQISGAFMMNRDTGHLSQFPFASYQPFLTNFCKKSRSLASIQYLHQTSEEVSSLRVFHLKPKLHQSGSIIGILHGFDNSTKANVSLRADTSSVMSIFNYNIYYQLFACSQDCGYSTPLSMIDMIDNEIRITQTVI